MGPAEKKKCVPTISYFFLMPITIAMQLLENKQNLQLFLQQKIFYFIIVSREHNSHCFLKKILVVALKYISK